MKLIGLLVARNESWCIRAHLAAAARHLDGMVVIAHACNDDTDSILVSQRIGTAPNIWTIENENWDEAMYRDIALYYGRSFGGTHFVILDADELLTASIDLRSIAAGLAPGEVAKLPWLNCWRGLDAYRSDDSPFGRAYAAAVFADASDLHYCPDRDGYQLHGRAPRGSRTLDIGTHSAGGVMHLQHANWRRVLAKQALYQVDEVLRWPGRRPAAEVADTYRRAVDETGLQTTPIPPEWWPVDKGLIDLNAEPWQAAELARCIEQHGRERFAGLDLFGL